MSESILHLEGLEKSYGKVRALAGVSVAVPHGSVGLLGPNGAGKTTLLKLLLGHLRPDAGRADIAGCNPRTSRGRMALRRIVGYMPESDCLLPGMTGVELVSTLGRLTGLSREDAMTRSHETLDYVEIEEARYRSVEQYSTGMKQRLKLAQALVHDPQVLLLDEPTNGLDPKGRRHMLELIHDLGHAQQKNLLLCSHLLKDVERTCDHVLVLNKGAIVASGSMSAMTSSDGLRLVVETGGTDQRIDAFVGLLEGAGFPVTRQGSKLTLALATPEGSRIDWEKDGADPIFALAAEAGAHVAGLDLVRSTLEEVFLSAVGATPREVAEPTHEVLA